MQYEMSFGYLGQHGITHFHVLGGDEQGLVAPVFQKRSHAPSPKGQGNGLAFKRLQFAHDEGQELCVG